MMTSCSWQGGEVHHHQQSATEREPPTRAPFSPLEEGVSYQQSSDAWGNQMGKKQATTLRIVYQNLGGFLQDEEMDLKFKVFC